MYISIAMYLFQSLLKMAHLKEDLTFNAKTAIKLKIMEKTTYPVCIHILFMTILATETFFYSIFYCSGFQENCIEQVR